MKLAVSERWKEKFFFSKNRPQKKDEQEIIICGGGLKPHQSALSDKPPRVTVMRGGRP